MSYKNLRNEIDKILSLESTNQMNDVMEVTDGCSKNLVAIQMDNSTSLEHWDNIYKNCVNDGILMQQFNLIPMAERNRKKAVIKNMFDKSLSVESITQTAEILSLESIKSFGKKIWDALVQAFQKILEAGAAFVRMINRVFKGAWATTQTGFYEKNKNKLSSAKGGEAGKKELKLKPFKVKVKDIEKLVNDVVKSADQIKSLVDGELSASKMTSNEDLLDKIENKLPKTLVTKSESPREAAVKEFFNTGKIPAVVSKSANEWSSTFEFSACSKEFLDKISKMEEAGKSMMSSANIAIKKIKEASKKWESEEKKAGGERKDALKDESYNKEKKEIIKKASTISAKIAVLQVYIREVFLLALDYRTGAYRTAKTILGGSSSKEDKK